MKTRQRLLLVVFLVSLVIWQGRTWMTTFFSGPLASREVEVTRLDAQLAQLQEHQLQMIQASRRLNDWIRRSLPADPFNAQRLYQNWLTDLGQRAGLAELKVTPEQRIANGQAFVAVQVALEGRAELGQLIDFLYHFYRTDLLHSIVQFSLDGDEEGRNPMLSFSLVAEGLTLPTVRPRKELFPQTELKTSLLPDEEVLHVVSSDTFPNQGHFRVRIGEEVVEVVESSSSQAWKIQRALGGTHEGSHGKGTLVEFAAVHPSMQDRHLADYQSLSPTQLFLRPKPIRRTTRKPSPPPRDAANDTYLIASILEADHREAWLYDQFKKEKWIVREGQFFSAGDIRLTVLYVDRDGILVEQDGTTWRLEVGESLRSLKRWEQDAFADL